MSNQKRLINSLIDIMTDNQFYLDIQINPLWEDTTSGTVAKELPRAIKITKVYGETMAIILQALEDYMTPDQKQKLKKAIQKLLERKNDEFIGDQ